MANAAGRGTTLAGELLREGRAARVARGLLAFARRKPLGALAGFILLIIIVVAIFGPLLAPKSPYAINQRHTFASPGEAGFLLGTDNLGRDNLSRLILGTRTSLTVAAIGVSVGSLIGLLLGLVSGYALGMTDAIIQRFVDILMSLPLLVFALAIVAVLGQEVRNVIIAIAIVQIPGTARVIRSGALGVREADFVTAARAIGARDSRIVLRHILPATIAPYIIVATAGLGGAILIEASLSFLGLGTPPPEPSWGAMLSGQAIAFAERAPWNVVFPGLALSATVFSFNLLGDALRDTLDPRLRAS